ncbi:acetyl-coenzyme A synthetase, partial [Mycobacteroides abscessus subsp. massiliense]
DDAQAKLVITSDGQWRRGTAAPLKSQVDEALGAAGPATSDLGGEPSSVEHVLVVRRTEIPVEWTEGRDLWWHETVDKADTTHTAEPFDSEHPL